MTTPELDPAADSHLFFLDVGGNSAINRHIRPIAQLYCADCPAIDPCRQLAQTYSIRSGSGGPPHDRRWTVTTW